MQHTWYNRSLGENNTRMSTRCFKHRTTTPIICQFAWLLVEKQPNYIQISFFQLKFLILNVQHIPHLHLNVLNNIFRRTHNHSPIYRGHINQTIKYQYQPIPSQVPYFKTLLSCMRTKPIGLHLESRCIFYHLNITCKMFKESSSGFIKGKSGICFSATGSQSPLMLLMSLRMMCVMS